MMVRQGLIVAAALCFASPVVALERLDFDVKGAAPEVVQALRGTSLLVAAQAAGETNPQDLLTAARADYGQLLGALYAKGYYSGVIRISLDGREVADLSPLEAPVSVGVISVRIET